MSQVACEHASLFVAVLAGHFILKILSLNYY